MNLEFQNVIWFYYASAFRHQSQYILGCPSVRLLNHPDLHHVVGLFIIKDVRSRNAISPPAHESISPSDQPWLAQVFLSIRRSADSTCLYVHRERFLGISPETFLWKEWPAIWHAGVSWPPSVLIRLWSHSFDFPNFGAKFGFCETGQIFGFRTFLVECMKFCMLMYPDHLQND